VTLRFDRHSPEKNWVLEFGDYLPFDGNARLPVSFVYETSVLNAAGQPVYGMPNFNVNHGPNKSQLRMNFPEPVTGRVHVTARCDNPV